MKTWQTRRLLTRKDVAELMECSVDQVRKNEVRWGLRCARRDLNARCVRYLVSGVREALRRWRE